MSDTLAVENDRYRIEIEPGHGMVRRIRDKAGSTELITEPRLADNFRLLLPLPEMQANYILGNQQKLTSSTKTANGLRLDWNGPLQNERGAFDLGVSLWIELIEDAIQFRCEVQNRTAHAIAEVWYAVIGGMMGLGNGAERRATEALVPTVNTPWRQKIFTDFGNTRGQVLGALSGEHSFGYPGGMCMPWISLFNHETNRALYFAALEDIPRVKYVRFYLDPGLAERRPGGNWPRPEEVGDLPLGLTMNWTHHPYTKPGETFTSAPVFLAVHEGDWRESAERYRRWFLPRHQPLPPASTWIRRETAFALTMFMLPEDNINLTFKDIPAWARAAKDRGLRHVMITGWNIGGHDRGYPYYEPDPRLGTWDDLQAGVRAIHDLGLRVSFFINCQPVDMSTEWYRNELQKYRILDPHGVPYFIINYWGMGTLGARNRFISATPFTEINPSHPEVRALLIRQFRRIVEIGADGLHIDKFFQTPFDFNPLLKNTSPDRAHHEGILRFVGEFVTACRAVNPEFCFSYEGGWDRLMPYAETSWWGWEDDSLKAVFPQRTLTTGVEQPYDYAKVNQAVLKGFNLLVGPGNYTRGMDYPPMQPLCKYITEITRIRQELFDCVSVGEILDASDGLFRRSKPLLRVNGSFAKDANARWTVFLNSASGQRALVLANFSGASLEAADVMLEGSGSGKCRVYLPFEPTREASFPLRLQVPAERVAFVVERS